MKLRIVTAIKQKYPHLSQKQIKKIIEDKNVTLNGKTAKLHDKIDSEDKWDIPKNLLTQTLVPNAKVNCRLIKKTDDFIFFDKGPGIHSVAQGFSETETAANWLLSVDPKLSPVSHPLESGLLHRLDGETSGIMVSARTKEAFDFLKNQFQQQTVHKEYLCLVTQEPPVPGTYHACAMNAGEGAKKVKVLPAEMGAKEIVTEILSVKKVPATSSNSADQFLVTISLISGYRHQIRAHLAYLGSPILGDVLYGGEKADRLMLHAHRIEFVDRSGVFLSQISVCEFA